jgi:hypothetical protein
VLSLSARYQRFLSAANRFASISKSSSGAPGFASFAGASSSVGGSSGSLGVRAPLLLASADIVAASGSGESSAFATVSDYIERRYMLESAGMVRVNIDRD